MGIFFFFLKMIDRTFMYKEKKKGEGGGDCEKGFNSRRGRIILGAGNRLEQQT